MNTTRKALELVEDYVKTGRHWAFIDTYRTPQGNVISHVSVGPLHDNGYEEAPTHTFVVRADGEVIASHMRI